MLGANRASVLTLGNNARRARLLQAANSAHLRPRSAHTMNSNSDPMHASRAFDYDLFVIGAGSGGVRASRIAAGHGAKVAVAEQAALGGTCVNVGCVPKKLFVYGSHYGHDFVDARSYGWDVLEKPTLTWKRLIENKNAEIKRLNGIYAKLLSKVDLKQGTAKLVDRHTVEVAGERFTSDKILVAVGGKPFVPEFDGSEHVITSNEAFYLDDLPKRIVVVGGGYIAVEFANIFHGYGAHVNVIYRRDVFLRGFDDDIRHHLAGEMRAAGVKLTFNANVERVKKLDDGSYLCMLDNGDIIETDCVMYATGRIPYTKGMGLENAGVEVGKKGQIIVDDYSKTNVNNIYAIGDVTDRVNLTPVAIAEGQAFADTAFGGKKRSVNYENIPTAVFSTPSIGTCGLTETEARKKYGFEQIDIYKTDFRPMKHTLTHRDGERVFMKLVVHRESDLVVGCHMLDAAAGEVIQLVGVAMKAGATKSDFDSTMPVHPVSAEEMVTLRTKEPQPAAPEPARTR